MSGKLRLATMDYTKEFTKWSLWYIPIFALVYIVLNVFLREPELNEMSFFAMALSANRIYMLVLGILAAYTFLEWSINLGLTRKIFLRAVSLAGILVTLFITALTAAISFLLGLMPWFGTSIPEVSGGTETLVHVGGFLLSTLLYFLGGFLISVGFYRGFLPGMAMILLDIILYIVLCFILSLGTDIIWFMGDDPGFNTDNFLAMSLPVMILVSIAAIAGIYGILSLMIRDIPMKIK
ncbi:hypothetical protein [Salinicoccus sp. HZC-1]|uniref:hypothetical protein n=1 Tax=Salinicoccus sp. HZC-1 TaxID=3385497 RepID=UPI00398A8500